MNITEHLFRSAARLPNNPAVSIGKRVVLDYATLASNVSRMGSAIIERFALRRGDNVALVMDNSPQYVELFFALWHVGLTAVPVNSKLHAREIAWILDQSESKLCFASRKIAEAVAGDIEDGSALKEIVVVGSPAFERLREGDGCPMVDLRPDENAWLFYTSGTTGRPKGAMLAQRSLLAMATSFLTDVDTILPGDAVIHVAPMSHGSGGCTLPHVVRGANNIIPESGGFDVDETFDLLGHWVGTSLFLAPTMVHRLTNSPKASSADTRHLKTVLYGGGPMYVADLLAAMDVFGPKFVQIYGQGEAPMSITALPKWMHARETEEDIRRLGSVGVARANIDVKVVDDAGRFLPTGEAGEVVCRGDVVMEGYWRNAEATAATIKDGWLHTGDVGSLDAAGYLTLIDRSKDMIISGGSNIYPREIEEVLLRHDDVSEIAIVGKPNREWGEDVVAFVVPKVGETDLASQLDELCLANLARFKRPKEYRIVESLPKNNYGKVVKTELRKLFSAEL